MSILPEGSHELDRVDRLLAVDHHLTAFVDLLAAPRPHIGVGERRRVAERVAKRLSDWTALRFQLLADLVILLPRVRKFVGAHLGKPGFAVRNHAADDGP